MEIEFFWVISQIVISIVIIASIHYIYNFFKQNQKYELAEVIVRNIDFQAFLSQNIYRDASNSNHIFLSYPNIKPILCPSTYKPVIDFLDNIIIQVINDGFNTFYAHVDIFSVTPSSISRFKNLI